MLLQNLFINYPIAQITFIIMSIYNTCSFKKSNTCMPFPLNTRVVNEPNCL